MTAQDARQLTRKPIRDIALVLVVVAAIVRVGLYLPWQNFMSNGRLLGQLSYCLGFFDQTRRMRAKGRLGDGTDELARMREFVRMQLSIDCPCSPAV
jgi:hypothetical protein